MGADVDDQVKLDSLRMLTDMAIRLYPIVELEGLAAVWRGRQVGREELEADILRALAAGRATASGPGWTQQIREVQSWVEEGPAGPCQTVEVAVWAAAHRVIGEALLRSAAWVEALPVRRAHRRMDLWPAVWGLWLSEPGGGSPPSAVEVVADLADALAAERWLRHLGALMPPGGGGLVERLGGYDAWLGEQARWTLEVCGDLPAVLRWWGRRAGGPARVEALARYAARLEALGRDLGGA